jgi:hypothetical protein
MKLSAFSSNSHPSEAGWHKYPDTAWDSKKKQDADTGIRGSIGRSHARLFEGVPRGLQQLCASSGRLGDLGPRSWLYRLFGRAASL